MKLYPELISLSELKRIMSNTMKKTITDEKQVEITYLQFERLLKNISEHCFPSSNSLKLMITHLKGPCSSLYSIPLTTIAPIHTVYEKQAKVSSSSKGKNTSVTHRKILNNSASQRIATSKIEAIHSPRERTLLNLKIFQQKSPRLKILNIQNKLKDDRKYEKIHRTFNVFKNTHKAILRSKRGKRLVVRFLERFIESKMRLSWMMNVTFEIWKIKSLSKPLN